MSMNKITTHAEAQYAAAEYLAEKRYQRTTAQRDRVDLALTILTMGWLGSLLALSMYFAANSV